MLVKICGITTAEDAKAALHAGADWIGLNLVGGPRRVSPEAALDIAQSLEDASRVVVLLGDETSALRAASLESLAGVGVGAVQCYGREATQLARDADAAGMVPILVEHVTGEEDALAWSQRENQCREARAGFVLLDASDGVQLGGTGRTLAWSDLGRALKPVRDALPPIILAGGLTAQNVGTAIAQLGPAGVDVSSGVEDAPGQKNARLMRAFVEAVRAC